MPLTIRSLEQVRDLILARKQLEEVGLDTALDSDAWNDANAMAHLAMDFQADLADLATNLFPTTATGDPLLELGRVYLPDGPRAASVWAGVIGFTASSGTPTVPVGQVCAHADGTTYKTTAAITAAMWAGGVASTTAESITTGTTANKANATTLTVQSPPGGLSAAATLNSTTTLATDDESEDQTRIRVLAQTQGRPGGGNDAHYVVLSQEIEGVSEAFVYPEWDDDPTGPPVVLGTVTVVPWGPSGDRIVAASVVTALQAYLTSLAPIGATVTVEAVGDVGVGVSVWVRPEPGFGGDWPGTFTVASCLTPFTRVTLTTDPTGVIEVGDHVVCLRSPSAIYEQRIAKAVGTNYVDVTEPFTTTVVSTVYPGGPLWQGVFDAIVAVFDSIGPYKSSDVAKPRYPDVRLHANSALCLSDLYAAIDGIAGVSSSRITSPAADVDNSIAPGAAVLALTSSGQHLIRWE